MQSMTFREVRDKMALLYTEGKYADALELVEQNASRFPEQLAATTFWKMCLLSLCQRPDEVLSLFRQVLDSGLWWAESQFRDSDLDAVRDLPEFKRLVAASQEKYEEARRHVKRDQVILLSETPTSASGKYPLLITLHGRPADKDANLEHWQVACEKGWIVLSPQSTQPLFTDAYCWDDAAQGLADLLCYYEEALQSYPVDPERIVIAGLSQGSGMAIYAALQGSLPVRGFIGVATWWADVSEFVCERKDVRGYFILGGKDRTLDRARAIQGLLKRNNVPFAEEFHAELGHVFPSDFGASFDKAIEFIFEEHE